MISINTGIITSLVSSEVIVQRLDGKISLQTYLEKETIATLKLKKLFFLMLQFFLQKH